MNSKEKILKYLSGMLTDDELAIFDNELKNDANLQSEFKKINAELESLKFTPEIEEHYFVELERKAKAKKENGNKVRDIRYALSFGVAAIVIFFFIITIPTNNNNNGLNNIINQNSIATNLSVDEISDNYTISDFENMDISIDDYFTESISLIDDNTLISYISSEDIDNVEDLISSVSLTDESFKSIITTLKNKNY